jgi:pyruvate/2-oxoglutarate dehydrogenase complex dihydrolipoamide acyltransferase (E2) component
MPGRVVRVLVAPGDESRRRQPVVVVEAMKMENELRSPKAGRVKDVAVDARHVGRGRARARRHRMTSRRGSARTTSPQRRVPPRRPERAPRAAKSGEAPHSRGCSASSSRSSPPSSSPRDLDSARATKSAEQRGSKFFDRPMHIGKSASSRPRRVQSRRFSSSKG